MIYLWEWIQIHEVTTNGSTSVFSIKAQLCLTRKSNSTFATSQSQRLFTVLVWKFALLVKVKTISGIVLVKKYHTVGPIMWEDQLLTQTMCVTTTRCRLPTILEKHQVIKFTSHTAFLILFRNRCTFLSNYLKVWKL